MGVEINRYFDGNVISIPFANTEGRVSSCVMQPGKYIFGTIERETMRVTSGVLYVKMQGEDEFTGYRAGSEFSVHRYAEYSVKVEEMSSYVCFHG